MSYDHFDPRVHQLQARVVALMAEAEMKDKVEDRRYEGQSRGKEIPSELQRCERHIAKLKEFEAARQQATAAAAKRCAQQARANRRFRRPWRWRSRKWCLHLKRGAMSPISSLG